MPGETRQVQYGPVTPARDGVPPGWYVVCLTCDFAVDAHGVDAEEALESVAPRHDRSHTLTARPVDYSQHPLYRR